MNKEIFKKIAEQEGTTPEDIISEMQQAIDESYDNPSPEARRFWEDVPRKSDRPTAEETIDYIAEVIRKRRNLS